MRHLIIILFITMTFGLNAKSIHVVGPQSKEDVSQSYFIELLQLALDLSNDTTDQIIQIPFKNLTHGRTLHLLENKMIDVFWAGTTTERELQFNAIKIPLFKGLLGYRTFIINAKKHPTFVGITEQKLKNLIACQGEHWPDTKILQFNEYAVMSVARFDLMFKMVNVGRCDYFPRAIFEGYGELEVAKLEMPELSMFDSSLIHYPFPIYYFVHKDNIQLANKIETNLLKMINSGKFDQFMQQHKLTKHLFPLSKWKQKNIFELTNPFLPNNVDLNNKKYWLKLN